MIRIYASKRGEKYRLFVVGHAEKSGQGALVCAAVSALTEALVSFARHNPACRYVRVGLESGSAFLSCCFGLRDTFAMTVGALRQLADKYPMHIRFCSTPSTVNDRERVCVLQSP